ncbi:helix-turn-helix domain-containing protein [Streptomyces boninensis]|uniref:helix-turn-helix domain-containing protein n=1 Tax=Streptomyces boninensis TaxID=2039455 RepID=UPI003B20E920
MARWRELPEELDPQVREFASQLRRLVDRSRLSVSAVADRTGYSRSSWERYLNGRLLPPQGAVEALAEVTGANARHLHTMWELAERAWSRAEMRHDHTLEAIQVAEARAALGEFGPAPAVGDKQRGGGAPPKPAKKAAKKAAQSPAQPPGQPGQPAGPYPAQTPPPQRPKRRNFAGIAAVAGAAALIILGSVVAVTQLGGDDKDKADDPKKSPTSSQQKLPAGVKCVGDDCTGKDPEEMGCGGEKATSPENAVVQGAEVEVRYSKVCKAAWARISGAVAGDSVRITAQPAGGKAVSRTAVAETDGETYTKMVGVTDVADAKACGDRTKSGMGKGCTGE